MDGILIIDKPTGMTSHDVIDFIRSRFHLKKVGHAGTLDPQASGVLVILLGKFTKRFPDFSTQDKEYEACLTLGVATDSGDSEGKIVKREDKLNYSFKEISAVFQQFLGKISQIPPMFSALKYQGKALYTLARQGIEVERPARSIQIYALKITELSLPHIYFTVRCSKGTYIRSLCQDITTRLGCCGYMSKLRKIKSGPFGIKQAIRLEQLANFSLEQLRQVLLDNFWTWR